MDNQKAKMLGENLAHYKRMQENGTVDIIEFHTTDGCLLYTSDAADE